MFLLHKGSEGREGGGKEGSALAHDYELCSLYLADQTAEDLGLQCSFSLGDALSDTRNKRGLSSSHRHDVLTGNIFLTFFFPRVGWINLIML